jgi:hypothetical protein
MIPTSITDYPGKGESVDISTIDYGIPEITLGNNGRGFWVYVGGTGNVIVDTVNGGQITFTAFPTGELLPVRVSNVVRTGTTATAMVALFD